MAYQRRFYYENSTGKMILSDQMKGSFVPHDQDWDFVHQGALIPYADRRGAVGCFEWLAEDEAVEKQFEESYGQSVDVSVTPHKLVFDYTPPPAPPEPDPSAELQAAYQAGGDAVLGLVTGGSNTHV